MSAKLRFIELTEYQTKLFHRDELTELAEKQLVDRYAKQVDLYCPSYKTRNQWILKAKGWVGYIPLTPELGLKINPKVPIKNLFGMLEYAYHLKSFRFLDGDINCDSLAEFYNNLACVLAQRILERCRQGLYRTYATKTEKLAYVRGRLDVRQVIQKPWDVKLKCHYEEQTVDIKENQILAWTLYIIGRSGLCSERVSLTVRKAYHPLQGWVTPQSCSAEDCIGRQYNRLNEDYRLLHNLCRFFLENTAPNHEKGNYTMLPFLVDMARLYELFVAEWLKANLPSNLFLKFQERVNIGKNLEFKPDLVLYDSTTNIPRYILDTKYKTPATPSSQDVAQVVAYAVAKNCPEVILVYPTPSTHSLNEMVGNIRVRSLTFSLDDHLEKAGNTFLKTLIYLDNF